MVDDQLRETFLQQLENDSHPTVAEGLVESLAALLPDDDGVANAFAALVQARGSVGVARRAFRALDETRPLDDPVTIRAAGDVLDAPPNGLFWDEAMRSVIARSEVSEQAKLLLVEHLDYSNDGQIAEELLERVRSLVEDHDPIVRPALIRTLVEGEDESRVRASRILGPLVTRGGTSPESRSEHGLKLIPEAGKAEEAEELLESLRLLLARIEEDPDSPPQLIKLVRDGQATLAELRKSLRSRKQTVAELGQERRRAFGHLQRLGGLAVGTAAACGILFGAVNQGSDAFARFGLFQEEIVACDSNLHQLVSPYLADDAPSG